MKNIAVIIFGDPRTYRKCYSSLFYNIIDNNKKYNFDIFLVLKEKYNNNKYNFSKYYKQKKIFFIPEKYFKEKRKELIDNNCSLEHNNINIYSYKYSIGYVIQISAWNYSIKHSKINFKKYDYIIKTRFDIMFFSKVNMDIVKNNILTYPNVFCIHKNNNIKCDDLVIIGNTKNMLKILGIYNEIKNNKKLCNRKTQYEDMGLEKLVGIYIKNILKLNFIYDIEYEIIRCDWFNLKIKNLESNTRCIDDDNNYNKNYQNLFKLKKEKNINLKKVKDILNKNNIKFNVTSDDNIYIKI